jgi:hypothetical protein
MKSREISSDAEAVRSRLLAGTVPLATFAQAVGRTERTVRSWIVEGLPVLRIGNTSHIILERALDWLRKRSTNAGRLPARRQGRPRKAEHQEIER